MVSSLHTTFYQLKPRSNQRTREHDRIDTSGSAATEPIGICQVYQGSSDRGLSAEPTLKTSVTKDESLIERLFFGAYFIFRDGTERVWMYPQARDVFPLNIE
jgi:hypothetical protein